MFLRFVLIIPKIENEALNQEVEYITKSLLITKEQLKIIGKSLKMQSSLEVDLYKKILENEIKTIIKNVENVSEKEIIKRVKESKISDFCSFRLSNEKMIFSSLKDDFFYKNNRKVFEQWQKYSIDTRTHTFKKRDYYFYNYKFPNYNLLFEIGCSGYKLNPNHAKFEKELKGHLHTNLLIDSNFKSAKSVMFWINPQTAKNRDLILYEEDEKLRKEKYRVSRISNSENIPTGDLTIKEILDSKDKNKPISHFWKKEELLTWIIDLSTQDSNKYMFLAYSINKNELKNKNRSKLLFLLPETLIAMGISFILILLLFKRVLKNLNTITKTAVKVNKGVKNIRSNVKGNDDIGILGKSFDNMLDFFENNISTLDKIVEEKTKEISKSLEEKEILLKEIHHRVKNNLALTISFIELQEDEIEDEKVKKVLIDIQERIYTMELLHRKLYESTTLNKIPFKNYITDLVNAISKTYDINNRVKIFIDIEDIELDLDFAMPCGLILNELITNTFKYAFKQNDNPTLFIKIFTEGEFIKISVKDNGKGFKADYDSLSNSSLGLKLVNSIVSHQLFGTIKYKYEKGSLFIIEFNLKDKE